MGNSSLEQEEIESKTIEKREIITDFNFPEEILATIYSFLTPIEIYNSMTVSKKYSQTLNHNIIWKQIYFSYEPKLSEPKEKVENWKQKFYETPKWLKNKEEWLFHCSCSWYGKCEPKNMLNRNYEYDMNGKVNQKIFF